MRGHHTGRTATPITALTPSNFLRLGSGQGACSWGSSHVDSCIIHLQFSDSPLGCPLVFCFDRGTAVDGICTQRHPGASGQAVKPGHVSIILWHHHYPRAVRTGEGYASS